MIIDRPGGRINASDLKDPVKGLLILSQMLREVKNMKHKHLLLTTAVAMMLTACGTTNEQPTHPDANILKEVSSQKLDSAERYSKIKKSVLKYMFSDSSEGFDTPPSILNTQNITLTISTPVKKILSTIWSNLESKGFSATSAELGLDKATCIYNIPKIKEPLAVGTAQTPALPVGSDTDQSSEEIGSFSDEHTFQTKIITRLLSPYMPNANPVNIDLRYLSTDFTPILDKFYFKKRQVDINGTTKRLHKAIDGVPFTYKPGDSLYEDISESTLKEWNQVFIDAFKADPFFKQFFEAPVAPADTSGLASGLAALKGRLGMDATSLMVNGISGSQVDLGLPMYVQLKGSLDHGKSTTGMTGLVAYKLGNSVLGVVQSYSNSGTGFNAYSRQLESSVIAAHSFVGLMFVEGQFGSVSATDVNFKNWSGVRSQVRLGVDTPFGAPFVQLTHRDFGLTSDTAGYVGFELATTEFKADTYAFSTSLLTKVGRHSVHGATGSIDWTAALNLNSGVAFNTNLTLGSTLESKAAFNLSLDR